MRGIPSGIQKTKLNFLTKLPAPSRLGKRSILLFDRKLLRVSPAFRRWSRGFRRRLGVKAGEGLKELDAFPRRFKRILSLSDDIPARDLVLVAAGGGSLGDFTGFAASVLKRGVRLIHIPSTWLAALDSSHGGKTALNANRAKNQLGTFYPAERVFLVWELLKSQPPRRAAEAKSELIKMALIDGGSWTRRLFKSNRTHADLIWDFLREAVRAKYRVVEKDPTERTGHRRILNLGHTLGHVLEVHHGLAHGAAVALGLYFAVEWSRRKDFIGASDYRRIRALLEKHLPIASVLPKENLRPIVKARFLRTLGRDKKRDAVNTVQFVFLRGIGMPVRRAVSLREFHQEAKAAGWAR